MFKIPFIFKDVSYEKDVPESIKKIVDTMTEHRKGLYIHGPYGAGKTHMAYAIAKKLSEIVRVEVFSSAELLMIIKEGFGKEEETTEGDMSKLHEILDFKGLLVIDDFGVEKMTEWVAETLDLIINKRYQNAWPTIFTSNFDLSELAKKVGGRIPSRIVAMCEIVEMDGKDRRLEGKK